MESIIIIILLAVNAFTVYKFLFNNIFNDADDFSDSLRYSFTPNIISLFRGEYWKDRIGEFKLIFFIIICILATAIEYSIVSAILRRILLID